MVQWSGGAFFFVRMIDCLLIWRGWRRWWHEDDEVWWVVRVHRRVLLLIGRVLLLGMRSSLLSLLYSFFRECDLMARSVAFRGVYRQDDREFSISGLSSISFQALQYGDSLESFDGLAMLSYSLQARCRSGEEAVCCVKGAFGFWLALASCL